VYIASAWFERRRAPTPTNAAAADSGAAGAVERIGLVTLAVEAAYPEWNEKVCAWPATRLTKNSSVVFDLAWAVHNVPCGRGGGHGGATASRTSGFRTS
jgi:hypothetical protein